MLDLNHYHNHADAFNDMHRLTALNEPFKLTYRRVDGSVDIIPETLLRKQTPTSKDRNGAYKFNYIDKQDDRLGTAYIPLLMAVNDKKVKL